MTSEENVLNSGKNCWCVERSDRIAFLVDGEAIFNAFEAVAAKAEHSLLIVGWDIDSRVRMHRPLRTPEGGASPALSTFLESLVKNNKDLEIHILIWDFPVIYALDREPLPIFNLDWKTHSRIHLALDSEHPIGACHHQKIVVVDDQVAMVGGFDLSNRRWDTPSHQPGDPRRIDPAGKPYPPFHDVELLVQGSVAEKLGELARQRWYRATGKKLPRPVQVKNSPWPLPASPDLTDMPTAIGRTEPAYKDRLEVREIEQLYIDAIASAQRYLYIENQYLTSRVILQALLVKLQEKDGPEIVIILPRSNSGWLEETTMGNLRGFTLQALLDGDRYRRLGIYSPVIRGPSSDQTTEVRIHSKLLIADDRLVIIGSANLNNRSMGFDTECNLALEAEASNPDSRGIAGFRNRLLAEHLGANPERVGEAITRNNSMLAAIKDFNGQVHVLERLSVGDHPPAPPFAMEIGIVDPEQPIGLDRMMDKMLIEEEAEGGLSWLGKLKLALTVVFFLLLLCIWQLTPLRDLLDARTLAAWAETVQDSPLSGLYIILAYIVGGLIFFPVTIQIVATSALFPPLSAFFFSLAGCLASGILTFALGHWLGRETIRNIAGGRLNRISKRIARRGTMAIGALRLVPIAPFTLVNLVAGASHIRFRDYLLGTFIGMLPGVAALTLVTDRLKAFLNDPGLLNMVLLIALLVGLGVGGYYLKKRLSRQG